MKKIILSAIVLIASMLTSIAQTDIYMSAYFSGTTSVWVTGTTAGFNDNSKVRTFEMWAKRDSVTHTAQTIVSYLGTLDINVNYDTIYATYGNTITTKCVYPLDTNWHHIAFVCDTINSATDTNTLYIDGTAIAGKRGAHIVSLPLFGNTNLLIGTNEQPNMPVTYVEPGVKYWFGNICRLAISDTAMYTSSFVPDCVYDTVMFWASGTISAPYVCLIPLTQDTNIYYQSIVTPVSLSPYPVTLGTSPCAPTYMFYCPSSGTDSVLLRTAQTNRSYQKGAHMIAHHNGWDGSSTSVTYGTFVDSMTVYTTATYPYTDDYHHIVSVDTLITINTTAVHNVSVNSNITIYPNPSTGQIHIATDKPLAIVIYDMSGHIVYNANTTASNVINLSKGYYILTADNTSSYKILVE